jgi:esterase/lipase superfamily enzyme
MVAAGSWWMHRGVFAQVFLFVVCAVVLTVPLSAQRRAVRGRVTDAAGAPVADVVVTLLKDSAAVRSTVTDTEGAFNLDLIDLADGAFEVQFQVSGGVPGRVTLRAGTSVTTAAVGPLRVEVRASALEARATPPSKPETAPKTARRPAPLPPAPPPPPPTPVPVPPALPAAPDLNTHASVPVFFATDRNRIGYTPLSYGGEREPTKQLHLGRIDVSIPRDHQAGQVERPTIWTLYREDPDKHFVIIKATEQPYDEFYRQLREIVAASVRKEAFVFVHGYNVAFEAAVYRTAQIAYDLGFDGAPILYSWPSVANPAEYLVDANNSDWTIDRLHYFLEDVAAKTGANYIHVIAHSRGNWPVMQALNAIATEPRNAPRPHFRQIILTAPDVDADKFRELAHAVETMGDRTTLYASSKDEALALSKQFQGYQRAGDVQPDIVVVPGLDSIDVSNVDTSFLGHSYVGDNTSVIADIARLLRTGFAPGRRCGLNAVPPTGTANYWMFIAHAICPAR